MEQSSSSPIAIELIGWTGEELALLKSTEDTGFKPISPTLAAQMFTLFLNGYSCSEIAKNNKGFSEADILYCRKKFNWDSEKDKYTTNLTIQARESLQRQKMESIEFLTNTMSVMHKRHREKMLRYLQTGDSEDLPEFQITSMKMYKEVIETISKITGEDKVQKHLVQANVTHQDANTEREVQPSLTQELQSKILRALASGQKGKA